MTHALTRAAWTAIGAPHPERPGHADEPRPGAPAYGEARREAGGLRPAGDPAEAPHGRASIAQCTTQRVLLDDGLRVNLEERTTMVGQRSLDLTFLEFELLAYLLLHPRQVFTRRQLMETVWGYPEAGGGRTVDVHIARLRRKLGTRLRYRLATVRRVGYKYVPNDVGTVPPRVPAPRALPELRHRA